MLEDALVDPLLRGRGEGVVPLEGGGAVLRADGVVCVEVRGDVGLGGRLDPGEECEREGEGEEEGREAAHCECYVGCVGDSETSGVIR